jgi:hypothetical protein
MYGSNNQSIDGHTANRSGKALDDWVCASYVGVFFCLMGQFRSQKTLIYLSFVLSYHHPPQVVEIIFMLAVGVRSQQDPRFRNLPNINPNRI